MVFQLNDSMRRPLMAGTSCQHTRDQNTGMKDSSDMSLTRGNGKREKNVTAQL